jgi:hypothetical protein
MGITALGSTEAVSQNELATKSRIGNSSHVSTIQQVASGGVL